MDELLTAYLNMSHVIRFPSRQFKLNLNGLQGKKAGNHWFYMTVVEDFKYFLKYFLKNVFKSLYKVTS